MSESKRPQERLDISDPDAPAIPERALPRATAFVTPTGTASGAMTGPLAPGTPSVPKSLPIVMSPEGAQNSTGETDAPGAEDFPPPSASRDKGPSLEERLQQRPRVVAPTMSESKRFILATLCGFVVALGVHIVMVIAMPRLATQDAFNRLVPTMESETAVLVAGTGKAETWIPLPDPAAAVAACAYDLAGGPVRISARTGPLVQSISFHARGGGVFYAVTDRAAVRGQLELVLMTRRQYDEALADEEQDAPNRDVRVVAPRPEGFVVVRAIAPSPSLRPQAEEAVRSVGCTAEGQDELQEPGGAAPAGPSGPVPGNPPAARPSGPMQPR